MRLVGGGEAGGDAFSFVSGEFCACIVSEGEVVGGAGMGD